MINEKILVNPRRESRMPILINDVELLPIANSESIDFQQFQTYLSSGNLKLIKNAIFTLDSLLNIISQLPNIIEFISALIEPLYSFIQTSEKLKEANENQNPQYDDICQIASLSTNLLIALFSIDIRSDSEHSETFFSYFIQMISTTQEMEMLFCISSIIIESNPEMMRVFFKSHCYDFLCTVPILQLEPHTLKCLTSLIAICIDPYFPYPLEVPTKLLLQLIPILENSHNIDPKILDNCAVGCYNYVLSNQNHHKAMCLFLINNVHIRLLQAMPAMTAQGHRYAISALSYCFSCESEISIEESDLNLFNKPIEKEDNNDATMKSQTFNIDEILLQTIPLNIFATALGIEDDSIRADMANAVYNVMFKANLLTESLIQSQLFITMMNHFVSDAYVIQTRILNAFSLLYQNISPRNLHLFINQEFFQTLEGLIETDSPDIERIGHEIFTYVKIDGSALNEEIDAIVEEFGEFLFMRSLECT